METRNKKHPCPDCQYCQWCSDDRCRLCLKPETGRRKKLSIAEQIALFDRLNKTEQAKHHCRCGIEALTIHKD
ncbi:MAG: hypothetical protein DRH08_14585 [Deltaproteobacteria bacterium]|nr:MAG: hypothetical protein DRH08_14585 [Deltaproteobacteria bacterium]